MSIAIKAENISKAYRLGEIGTGTISQDFSRWLAKIRGKEDPFLKIGETNDRTSKGGSDVVWSLKDINFEIEQGDAVGIIGRNGAGKSTLLKVLSRVTSPTTGTLTGKGRIASLLEVGTGFHPELTGRENIFLNGAILGMRKKEIKRKFDEIVDFAGVERYIDTPVKRYSSGMYVRLAFAVAAHLESEILIVDEVLAVGDAEFQKKCLGKMGEVSKGEGRTVLFVSHNMGAVKALCKSGIFLKNGQLFYSGDIENAASLYMQSGVLSGSTRYSEEVRTNFLMQITSIQLYVNGEIPDGHSYDVFDKLSFEVKYHCLEDLSNYAIWVQINHNDSPLCCAFDASANMPMLEKRPKGRHTLTFDLPVPFLKAGSYSFNFHVSRIGIGSLQALDNVISFDIEVLTRNPRFQGFAKERPGVVAFEPMWKHKIEPILD